MLPSAEFKRRVLLVEDEELTRTLVAVLLENEGFDVSSCSNALDAVNLVDSFDPDVLIVDISLGTGPTGIDLVQALKNTKPYLSFMVLSNYAAAPASIKGLKNVAYLQKNTISDKKRILSALDSIFLNNDASRQFPFKVPEKVAGLTKQQVEVLSWMTEGFSNREIANRRNTTVESTEQMIGRIYKKLGLQRDGSRSMRVQAISYFRETLGSNKGA